MVELSRYGKSLPARLIAKLESFNPGGSVKDRIALSMIEDAEASGLLKPGQHIVEPTSGNTGVGVAMVAAAKGYPATFTMPESMSVERRALFRAYGANVELTPAADGMRGAIDRAVELEKTNGWFRLRQFENPANPEIHRRTTAQEILQATGGQVDVFVSGVGTGGTVTGAGQVLREKNPDITIVAVEPTDSAVLSGGPPGPHGIQGIGAGFVPEVLDTQIYDHISQVSIEDARAAARSLARTEGILVGVSAGAALHAATTLAQQSKHKGAVIVVILPDTGERYLSTPLFEDH
jgi:cysteine synthase A